MHNESNGDTIPLAAHRKALREAYVEGRMTPGSSRDHYEAEALRRWPEPEPPLRWVQLEPYGTGSGIEVARQGNGVWRWRYSGQQMQFSPHYMTDERMRALASLLPREPVAVTDETVRKAYDTWYNAPAGSEAFRLVAEAVAADLAGPVGVEKPKAQWWGVVDKDGDIVAARTKDRAIRFAAQWDMEYPQSAPHRVVGLAEVEG